MEKGQEHYNKFTTLDAYLAGYLSLQGIETRLISQNGKIAFTFPQSEDLRHSLADFNSGALVKANAYAFEIKSLKSRIHEMRRDKGNGRGFSSTDP